MGYALEPAEPAVYRFADGSELRLPTDRGAAFETLTTAYGSGVAEQWRTLIDSLGGVWQALRPLGLEAELHRRDPLRRSAQLTRDVRRRLQSRRSLAEFAASAPHPHLTALVRSVGYRLGSTPEQLPAMVAVDLWVSRTFGRWQIVPERDHTGQDAGRSSVLVEALTARLALRKVTVRTGLPVEAIRVESRPGHRRPHARRGAPGGRGDQHGRSVVDVGPAAAGRTAADPSRPALALPRAGPDDQPSTDRPTTRSGRRAGRPVRRGDTGDQLHPTGSRSHAVHRARLRPNAAQRGVRPGRARISWLDPTPADQQRGHRAVPGRAMVGRRARSGPAGPLRRPGLVRLS